MVCLSREGSLAPDVLKAAAWLFSGLRGSDKVHRSGILTSEWQTKRRSFRRSNRSNGRDIGVTL